MQATVVQPAEGELALPPAWERELYYVAVEALNNALKHAYASEVTVRIALDDSRLTVEIADNGRGFDVRHASAGYGLSHMRERVERLGGELAVLSAPTEGTRVVATVQLR